MNICLVNNLYPPVFTGSSFYTQDVAIHLAKRGHNVIVLTNVVEGEKDFEIQDDGVKIYRLPVIKLPRLKMWMGFPHFNYTLTPKNFKRIRKILLDEEIEVIHQCNNIFDLVFASVYFANRLNIPLVCTIMTEVQHLNLFYNKILDWFDRVIIGLLFSKKVFYYVAPDRESERYIAIRYKLFDNVVSVPFSIPTQDRGSLVTDEERDYSTTHFQMVSLGHISELKDREEMIKAWKIVVAKYPQAKLKIIGGLFSEDIKTLIADLELEDAIILTGPIPHHDLHLHLKDVDFGGLFLTSRIPFSKGFGLANAELMAMGIPVIIDMDAENFLGEAFALSSGKQFIQAESREPEWLAAKFIELFENPKMRESIGKAGKIYMRDVLTWDRIIVEMEKVYVMALEKKERIQASKERR